MIRNAPQAVITTFILCHSQVSENKIGAPSPLVFHFYLSPHSLLTVPLTPSESEQGRAGKQKAGEGLCFRSVASKDPTLWELCGILKDSLSAEDPLLNFA